MIKVISFYSFVFYLFFVVVVSFSKKKIIVLYKTIKFCFNDNSYGKYETIQYNVQRLISCAGNIKILKFEKKKTTTKTIIMPFHTY